MATDVNGKTPTWNWVAGIAMSGLMFFSSLLLLTALSDIREGRVEDARLKEADAKISERVKSIEDTSKLQFDAIKEWREEIRLSLEKIANHQTYNNARAVERSTTIIEGQKSAAKVKDWNKLKP